jgi:hypothetical protein
MISFFVASVLEDRLSRRNLEASERRRLVMAGAHVAITYVVSLGALTVCSLTWVACARILSKGRDNKNYVIVALLGQVRGEHGERQHLVPTASVTQSGINVRGWVHRVLAVNQAFGRLSGPPAFCDSHFGDDGSSEKHVIIALLGQVKGEHNERRHLIPPVNETKSGIKVRRCLRRTVAANVAEGRVSGPALCDEKGVGLTTRVMNGMLHEMLEQIRVEHKTLFLGDILSRADIEEKYNVYRSFRRGSELSPWESAISISMSSINGPRRKPPGLLVSPTR